MKVICILIRLVEGKYRSEVLLVVYFDLVESTAPFCLFVCNGQTRLLKLINLTTENTN